ncbi:MAG: class I SAM-dependent methyltransferase [Thaumarchaeota archaeon]|nr:class I SAM-dependent methyltransferase [Nitrososphaerota archaeon]
MYEKYLSLAKMLKAHTRCNDVLDIGCAKGFLVEGFLSASAKATGIDVSSYALEKSAGDSKSFLLRADGSFIPYVDKSFDLVTAIGVLDYARNPAQCMFEISRVLRKGGVLLMTVATKSPDPYRRTVKSEEWWKKRASEVGLQYSHNDVGSIGSKTIRTLSRSFWVQNPLLTNFLLKVFGYTIMIFRMEPDSH